MTTFCCGIAILERSTNIYIHGNIRSNMSRVRRYSNHHPLPHHYLLPVSITFSLNALYTNDPECWGLVVRLTLIAVSTGC